MEGKIGGDSGLSERGQRYAGALPALIMDNIGDAPLTVSIYDCPVAAYLIKFWCRCGRQLFSELSRQHNISPTLS